MNEGCDYWAGYNAALADVERVAERELHGVDQYTVQEWVEKVREKFRLPTPETTNGR